MVPAPELQILTSSWSINLNTSSIVAVILNVTTVGGTTTQFKLYQIFVQLSCLKGPLPGIPGTDFTCAVGTITITLPTNMNRTSTIVRVPITPPIDPELIEVHNLSFIVTGSPAPPPTPSCTTTFTVTVTPGVLNITRSPAGTVNGTFTKAIRYTGTCPTAAISLSAIGKGPGAPGTPQGIGVIVVPNVVTVPPGTTIVTEVIFVSPTTLPGQYQVVETDTSGSVVVNIVTIVNVF